MNHLDTFIELITDLAFFKDRNGVYTHCNEAFLKFNQLSRDALINKSDFDLYSQENALQFRKDDQEILASNRDRTFEEVFKRDGNNDEYFYTTKQIFYDANGEPLGLFCVARDITIKKQYEFIYEDSKTILEYIATHDDTVNILNKIVHLAEARNSHTKCSILRLNSEKKNLLTVSAPSLPDYYNSAINGVAIGAKVGSCGSAAYLKKRVIVDNIDTHENWKPYLELTQRANLHSCWSEPIFSSNDEIMGTFAVYSDRASTPSTFDLRLIESYAHLASVAIEKDRHNRMIKEKNQQLIQQSKLAQMGELISMIAHQWRQPLTAISATTANILIKLFSEEKNPVEERSYIMSKTRLIDEYILRLTHTIDDFRNFYKPSNKATLLFIDKPVSRTLHLLEASFVNADIVVKQEYQSKSKILIYESEMMQVVLNILQNAYDKLEDQNLKEPSISIRSYDEADSVVLEISDNGGGVDPKIIPRIFDPYFSTKEEKNGSGLGLYMSKNIIEEHHKGELFLENSKEGASFRIKIPRNAV